MVVLAGFAMVYGQNVTPPVVNKLVHGAAAEQSGMRPGDRVIAIDGRQIERFEQVSQAIFYRPDENADFTIKRGSETVQYSIKIGTRKDAARFGNENKLSMTGIQ